MAFFKLGAASYHYRRILWVIWLSALLLCLLVSWHVLALTQADYLRQFTDATRDLANLTRVSQEHANRTLRSADQVVRFVQAGYLEQGNKLDLVGMTRQGVIDAEIFNQVGIIDTHGIYALANRPLTGKLDLSDREHFKVHLAQNTGQMFVSKPVIGRATGKWSIQLTRRINLADGRFGGVVVLSVNPRYFTQFYAELNLGTKGVVGLYGLDGVGRARRVGNKEEFGSNIAKSVLFDLMRQAQLEGSYTEHSEVDGIERLYYFRKVPDYPLVAIAGLDLEEVLTNHDNFRNPLRLQALFLVALILFFAAALTRFLLNLRRAIEARIKAQREAQNRTDQLNAIIALSPDGFISFDALDRITFVNPAFYQMLGSAEFRLEGLNEQDFSSWLAQRCTVGSVFSGVQAMRARINMGDQDGCEHIRLETPTNRVLQVGMRCNQSGPVAQILYFRDVTVETEVDVMKSEFMTTAAHELRTPMTSILGFTELLLSQDHEPAMQHEFLSIVLERSQLMVSILDELLDLARIEARRGRDFRYTGINAQQLVVSVVHSLCLPADAGAPVMHFSHELPIVFADARKLHQALTNVLTNAYKYARPNLPNEVSISVTAKETSGNEKQICIEVTDTGIGMTPEQSRRIFERFYRADASGRVTGTGLGMSLVKEVVTLHHGEVSVVSVLGKGTSVFMHLPVGSSHSFTE